MTTATAEEIELLRSVERLLADPRLSEADRAQLLRDAAPLLDAPPPPRFIDYARSTLPFALHRWQEQILCPLIQRLATEQGMRVLFHAPPQFGKSGVLSIRGPAYLMGVKPNIRIGLACYNMTHAAGFGSVVRDLMRSEEHSQWFPDPNARLPRVTAEAEFSTLGRLALRDGQPSFHAMGLLTGFTGNGIGPGDCFSGETLVSTENGPIDFQTLYLLNCKPRVYAYDHETGEVVLKRVVAIRRKESGNLVRVTTAASRGFVCTADHRIFTRSAGYVAAQHLPEVQRLQESGERGMLLVLSGEPVGGSGSDVRPLPEGVSPRAVCNHQSQEARGQVGLLRAGVLEQASTCNSAAHAHLPAMRNTRDGAEDLLRPGVPEGVLCGAENRTSREEEETTTPQTGRYPLRGLQCVVPSDEQPNTVLRSGLRVEGALTTNDWEWEQPFQRRDEFGEVVRRDAPVHSGAGQVQVCDLRGGRAVSLLHASGSGAVQEQYPYPPYQSGHEEQYSREPDFPVQEVSPEAPFVTSDSVAVVEHLRDRREFVYDLQVEGCHNFFANEVLVHNCLLIDDPYASADDARSETISERVWRFWKETASPRVDEKANVVVMFHRYCDTDLAGRMLEQGGFENIRLPALVDDNEDGSDPTHGTNIREPDGRLSPMRSMSFLNAQKAADPFMFLGQFQGTPRVAGGNLFKDEWFRNYTVTASGDAFLVNGEVILRERCWFFQTVDLAASEKTTADYTVVATWAVTPARQLLLTHVERVRVEGPKVKQLIHGQYRRFRPSFIAIERNGLGMPIVQDLIAGDRDHPPLPIRGIWAHRDKLAYATGAAARYQAGQIFHPA